MITEGHSLRVLSAKLLGASFDLDANPIELAFSVVRFPPSKIGITGWLDSKKNDMKLQLGLETQKLLATRGMFCGLVYPGFPWQNALIAAIFFLSKFFLKHTVEEWLDLDLEC